MPEGTDIRGSSQYRGRDQHQDWLAARLDGLGHDDIDASMPTRLATSKKTALDKALGYFEANAPRMRYSCFGQVGRVPGKGAGPRPRRATVGHRQQHCA
jgi:hypothetical protein